MYSPFLWRIVKGQSLIIKKRWWRWPSNTRQICSQGLKLGKHVHQKLTMSRLNGHDSLQHTMNVWIIRSRRWRSSNSSRIHICISSQITYKRRRTRRCTKERLNLRSPLPKEGGTYRSYNMNRLRRQNSSKPKCNKIRWIKMGKKRPWAVELLLWTSIKERMKRWEKLIEASVTRAYKNAHLSKGIVCKWEISQIERSEEHTSELQSL